MYVKVAIAPALPMVSHTTSDSLDLP